MDVYENIKKAGIELPAPPSPAGIYNPVREFSDKLLYTSGIGPIKDGKAAVTGKLGGELDISQGQDAARVTILNLLSAVQVVIGDLNKIKRIVKVLGFVASTDDFFDQPKVMNAASQILIDIFGEEKGKAARSAIGVNVLPMNIPVEIEAVIELY